MLGLCRGSAVGSGADLGNEGAGTAPFGRRVVVGKLAVPVGCRVDGDDDDDDSACAAEPLFPMTKLPTSCIFPSLPRVTITMSCKGLWSVVGSPDGLMANEGGKADGPL